MAIDLPIRILLIDAHAHDRRLSRRTLRDGLPKVSVREVADVPGLVSALAEPAPLIVVADQDLGWADGVALLAQLKRRWPGCATVLFSSISLDRAAAEGRALRCDAVLRKDTAGWNALATVLLDLVAESREAVLGARRVTAAAETAAPAPGEVVPAAAAVPAATTGATLSPPAPATSPASAEDVGVSTVDWFPEMSESEAEGETGRLVSEDEEGAVHQLLPAVNLESVILVAMSQLKSLIRTTRARVRAAPLPALRLDRTDALALFRNLIANAIEHAGDRVPVVTIRAEQRENYWLLSVHDNGAGIAGRDVGEALHLIHPPGRHDDAADDGGLATCGLVARRYGGALWVQPRDGGGTSVFVALCTSEAASADDVSVTVQYQGHDMGRISVSSLSNKQQIAGRAMELPRLRSVISKGDIKDVIFIDADVVRVVA